jgi:hypothetical protein
LVKLRNSDWRESYHHEDESMINPLQTYNVDDFKKQAADFDPLVRDWRDLREEAIRCEIEEAGLCARRRDFPLKLSWDPESGEYWLSGLEEMLEPFESLAMRAAARLGYTGPYYVQCFLETLREHSLLFREEYEEDLSSTEPNPPDSEFEEMTVHFFRVRPTGCCVVESVFTAVKNVFGKFEALREVANEGAMERPVDKMKADLKAALERKNMVQAVATGRAILKARGEKGTNTQIYEASDVDHRTFYRILNGEMAGSWPYRRIEQELRKLL